MDAEPRLVLIGGLPGSGKTFLGKELASRSDAIFIDKDTVSRFFTEALLEELGCDRNDRESQTYLEKVRCHEYSTMMKHAFENLAIGRNVVCAAPFIREFTDEEWLDHTEFDVEFCNSKILLVWIDVDVFTARERIIARGADRDNWKLANWEQYISQALHTIPDFSREVAIIDNSAQPAEPVDTQVNKVVELINDY